MLALNSVCLLASEPVSMLSRHQMQAQLCRQHHEEAIKSFQRAATAVPNDAKPWFRLGTALFAAGQLPESQHAFKHALAAAKEPKDDALLPKLHVNLGISIEASGQLQEACQQYRCAHSSTGCGNSKQVKFLCGLPFTAAVQRPQQCRIC